MTFAAIYSRISSLRVANGGIPILPFLLHLFGETFLYRRECVCIRVHTCVHTYVDSIGYPVVEFLQGRQTNCLMHGLFVAVFKTSWFASVPR